MDNVSTINARRRWWGFGLFMALWTAVYFTAFWELAVMSGHNETYSHTVFIPFITLYFLVQERRRIFSTVEYSLPAGLAVVASGIIVYALVHLQGAMYEAGDLLPPTIASAWISLLGGFLWFFGLRAFRAALFPLLFLVFVVPLPVSWEDPIVGFLQQGSATFTNLIFQALGVTFVREGLVFHFSRISVEIAPQCSGIRSSLSLLITGTLAAHIFLRTWWGRGLLLLAVVPLAMVKNAIRITTLTLLAEYVDEGFITKSWLHHSGGFVFFGIALVLLAGVLLLIGRAERVAAVRGATGSKSA
jgi:exosortase